MKPVILWAYSKAGSQHHLQNLEFQRDGAFPKPTGEGIDGNRRRLYCVRMTQITRYSEIQPYTTKDGSQIRELLHPDSHGNSEQSLAEARVSPGTETILHRHHKTEELYHITAGCGLMTLGEEQFPVCVGDTVLIPPGTAHRIRCEGENELVILCCCSPAYAHEDTELL